MISFSSVFFKTIQQQMHNCLQTCHNLLTTNKLRCLIKVRRNCLLRLSSPAWAIVFSLFTNITANSKWRMSLKKHIAEKRLRNTIVDPNTLSNFCFTLFSCVKRKQTWHKWWNCLISIMVWKTYHSCTFKAAPNTAPWLLTRLRVD